MATITESLGRDEGEDYCSFELLKEKVQFGCSLETIVVELVVRGQGDKTTPAGTQGEERLNCCIAPHLELLIKH